jgi:hypothetical protein
VGTWACGCLPAGLQLSASLPAHPSAPLPACRRSTFAQDFHLLPHGATRRTATMFQVHKEATAVAVGALANLYSSWGCMGGTAVVVRALACMPGLQPWGLRGRPLR